MHNSPDIFVGSTRASGAVDSMKLLEDSAKQIDGKKEETE